MVQPYNAAWTLLRGDQGRGDETAAYVFEDRTISYGHLREQCRRFAELLRSRGLNPGDRVLLALADVPAFPYAFLGCILAGGCPVAVNTTLKVPDYEFFLNDSGARILVTSEDIQAGKLQARDCETIHCGDFGPSGLEACPGVFEPWAATPDSLGFMLYSSGSTGQPKGVPHRHEDLLIPSKTWGRVLGLTGEDVFFSSSKFFFAYGLLASLALPLAVGARTILFKGKPGPYDVFDIMAKHRPTVYFGVPTLYNLMLRSFERQMGPSIPRLCFSAGEALPPFLFEEWLRVTGRELLDGIGSTEAFNVFICNRAGSAKPGSSGRIVPGYEARLVDGAGHAVDSGCQGHLLIRGDSLSREYWNRPDKTRETFLEDGWTRTGDVYVETEGWYCHQGRSDDMFKAGGQWVSPLAVEEALLRYPAVAECAVAVRKVEGLEKACAFVIPANRAEVGTALIIALRKHALACLPEHMCPALFEFPAELPKTSTGKVQRFRLRES